MTGVLHPGDLIDRRRMPSIEAGDGGAARLLKALVQGGLGLDPACLRAAALLVVALETQATGNRTRAGQTAVQETANRSGARQNPLGAEA